jgi:hypothetical protein
MNEPTHTRRARRSRALLLLLLAMTISGCTSPAKFTPASGSEKFPPYEGEVRVLENLPSSNQFERVGVVIVEGVQLTKDASMVSAVKKEAAANGANAVVMQAPIKVTKDSSGGVHKRLAAWAIRLNR